MTDNTHTDTSKATDDRPVIGHVLIRLDLAGAEVLAAALARRLANRFRFVFLCLDGYAELGRVLQSEGFDVVDLGRKPGVDLFVARRIRKAVRRFGIDLLHAHQYSPFFYAAASRLLGSSPPILFTEHGRAYPDYRRPKRVLANRVLLKDTDRVTAVGSFIRQLLIDNEGIPGRRIEVVHNGIDPAQFVDRFNDQARARARVKMGVDDQAQVVMQVARFHSVKDHATAIRAFSLVHDTRPTARLVLVGDGPEIEPMRQFAWDQGVAEHCLFLAQRDDVVDLLPGADVFLLSSLSEGISVTLLEAMAVGLPIVATNVGGNSEVVEHAGTGLLGPRRDHHAMAGNLGQLLDDANLRDMLGQAGQERVAEHFNQQRMHDAYAAMYQQMLA